MLARSQFVLSKALSTLDKKRNRPRVQELATRARQLYEKAGRTGHHEQEDVKDWMLRSGLPRV